MGRCGEAIYWRSEVKYVGTAKKYMPLVWNLTVKDIKIKYRRSALGVIWSVLNPLLMMLVITAVFSTIFRFNIPNFPVYYLVGTLVFNFFSEATNNGMLSILQSAGLLKKVYIPKYIFALQKTLFSLVNALFSLIAVFLVIIITNSELTLAVLFLPIGLLMFSVFCLGVGMFLAVLATFFRDTIHLYSVVLTALSFLTPLFYPLDMLPENMLGLVKNQPLSKFVEYFRDCLLYGNVPSLELHLCCFVYAIIALLIGLVVFKKNQDKFILYI